MSLGTLLVLIGLGIFVFVLILFPEARTLLKGFTRIFIQDRASTPEGAKAVYAEKIDQLQEVYNKSDESLRLAAGKFEESKSELGRLQKRLGQVEQECENLVKRGQMELATVKAEERQEIIEQIANVDEMVTKYEEATKQATVIHEQAERALKKTKAEAKETVQRMKDNQNLTELYDNLNELKNTDGVDKLIEAVKDRDKELAQMATGAKVVHQNKLDTKLQIAEKESYKQETFDYLKSLQAKYNTGEKKAIPVNKK